MKSVYVHIPFCHVHCPYCDFNAYAGMDDLAEAYVMALIREIEAHFDGSRVPAIFFGGGTPTRLPARVLAAILTKLRDGFDVDAGAEVTIEANPDDVTEPYLAELLAAGFNRVSVGVQSVDGRVLKRLGRAHSADAGPAALMAARRAGFQRINADLIFGTPGETIDQWETSLCNVVAGGVDHVSCYALTIEEGTPFASWVARACIEPPDDDDQADKYELAQGLLTREGFVRYEVSNWSKPGAECLYNLGCWGGDDYFGFGAGAHSHFAGRRWWNAKNPRVYIQRSPTAIDGSETLDEDGRRRELLMLALRTANGAPYDEPSGPEIRQLIEDGFLEVNRGRIRPTDRGFLLNGHIARTILSTPDSRVLT